MATITDWSPKKILKLSAIDRLLRCLVLFWLFFVLRAPAQSRGTRTHTRSMERLSPFIIVYLPALVLRIVLVISSDRLRISLVDLGRIFDSRLFSILGRENHLALWKR